MADRPRAERRARLSLDVVEPLHVVSALATAALVLVWTLPSVVGGSDLTAVTGFIERAASTLQQLLTR